MLRRVSVSLIVVTFILSLATFTLGIDNVLATSYVGASTTGKFHYTDCRWANKIRADHRVFFSSREEALDAGYVPCKVCRP